MALFNQWLGWYWVLPCPIISAAFVGDSEKASRKFQNCDKFNCYVKIRNLLIWKNEALWAILLAVTALQAKWGKAPV